MVDQNEQTDRIDKMHQIINDCRHMIESLDTGAIELHFNKSTVKLKISATVHSSPE